MAESPSEIHSEIEKLERKHAEHPEGRFFVPLANAYRKLGDLETAEALLREGLRRHPDYLSAHIVLGRALADRGASREAVEEFRYVLSQDPQNLIALRTLGELALGEGRSDEASRWYEELLSVDPMNEDARQALESLSASRQPEREEEFQPGAAWLEAPAEDEPAEAGSGVEAGTAPVADSPPDEDLSFIDLDATVPAAEPPSRGDHSARSPVADEEDPFAGFLDLDAEPRREGGAEREGEVPDDSAEAPAGEEVEVVTETIAELYARQGFHERAAGVYRELIRRRGGDEALERRLAEMEHLAAGTEAVAGPASGSPAPEPAEEWELGDPFAGSFVDGFAGWTDGQGDAPDESPFAGSPEQPPGSHAPHPSASGTRIDAFLAGLLAWRPGAPVEATAAAPEPDTWLQPAVEPEREPEPQPEPAWQPEREPESEAEPDDSARAPGLESSRADSAGDVRAGDEDPFPWEHMAAGGLVEPERGSEELPREELTTYDELFSSPAGEEPDRSAGAEEAPSSAPEAPSKAEEDEDLESFQAWLRSLKR